MRLNLPKITLSNNKNIMSVCKVYVTCKPADYLLINCSIIGQNKI